MPNDNVPSQAQLEQFRKTCQIKQTGGNNR